MYKNYVIGAFLVIAFTVFSCKFPSVKLREVKFKPEIKTVISKYKNQLESELIQTSPGWSQFDTVTTHKVVIAALNSEKMPTSPEEIKKLALNFASDVYKQIENKSDYSKVEVLFQNQSGKIVSTNMKLKFLFTCKQLDQYQNENGKAAE